MKPITAIRTKKVGREDRLVAVRTNERLDGNLIGSGRLHSDSTILSRYAVMVTKLI